jgi:hypothetical protein
MDPNRSAISEAATRQILLRIASVFNDPDICDATFIVGQDEEKEEIRAPSQFMAISSSAFKAMFYPPTGNRETPKLIPEIQPYIFKKILDYLFRGMVPLNTIDDGWKAKVAARQFMLKDLEDLCTKFLKYRMDSQNIIDYLKNSTIYEAPDIRDAVIQRFTKEANSVLANDEILTLDKDELLDLLKTRPSMQARRLMDTLIRWAKKRYNLVPPKKEPKAIEDESEEPAAENGADGDVPMEAAVGEEDVIGEKRKHEDDDDKPLKPPTEPQPVIDMVEYIEPFADLLPWERSDTDYFLKEVHGKSKLSVPDENAAMVMMLNSFLDVQKTTPKGKLEAVQLTKSGRTSKKFRSVMGQYDGNVSDEDLDDEPEVLHEKPGHGGCRSGGIVKTE